MKKYAIVCAGLCLAMAFTSCGSSEKAYRKMYEKAQAADAAQKSEQPTEEVAVVTPVVEKPASETVVVDNSDNVPVRQGKYSVVSGAGLKAFSVVVGSYSVQANAEGMQGQLKNKGYAAQVAYDDSTRMYRVVISTFDTKNEAVQSRNQVRSEYPDAWLLYNN
ncbi:SPOR domain-containing protein [uncultured Prevotella sp.]|uniref:SPOR domain-containing protein n=1 Tax=uncultured Prevotella sp. TaxID=159272 RepID=UPI00260CBA38|nr:SPOR domain-containing protein [uncultured Prevotella sp.]